MQASSVRHAWRAPETRVFYRTEQTDLPDNAITSMWVGARSASQASHARSGEEKISPAIKALPALAVLPALTRDELSAATN